MTLTINIPVIAVVVVVVLDDVAFNRFFSQSYQNGLLLLLRSISGLSEISEQCVLSSVTENQLHGENNLSESM